METPTPSEKANLLFGWFPIPSSQWQN